MATLLEQQRLRLDLGLAADDTTNLPAATIDAIFVEAAETYTDANSLLAATRIIAIRRLRVQSAADVDYTQNNNSKKASQRFAHLTELLKEWQEALIDAVSATSGSAARFGRTTRKPARIKEHPGW